MQTRSRRRVRLIRTKVQTVIHRPVGEVFAYVVEPEALPQWQDDVVRAWSSPSDHLQLGATLHVVTRGRLRHREQHGTLTVTAYRPNQRVILDTAYGPFSKRTHCGFEPLAGGTRLVCA